MGAMSEYSRVISNIKVDGVFMLLGYESLAEAVHEGRLRITITEACKAVTTKPLGGCDHEAFRKWLEVVRLLLTLFKSENLVSGQDFGSGMIPVMKWPRENQIEGVDWKPGRLNFINKRLSERLYERLGERLLRDSFGKWYRFITKVGVEASGNFGTSGSSVTSIKEKVMKWMFKGVKAFAHVILDEYICVILLDDLLIAGKKGLACVLNSG
ncbi:hypothetical protein Tco_1202069 [Tanacetum coccineum]